MKKLLLMRHAESLPGDYDTDDIDRQLTSAGKIMVQRQAGFLKEKGILIDRIYSSNARRTVETSNLLIKNMHLNLSVIEVPFLYHNYATQSFIRFLHSLNENDQLVAVIAHNPEITQITQRLINSYTSPFKPATIALVSFLTDSWDQTEIGTATLELYQPA